MIRRWKLWRCRRGHDWFPNVKSEFIQTQDICLRCRMERKNPPWGTCICGATWGEHSDELACPNGSGGWR